jgi:hypothetical protein
LNGFDNIGKLVESYLLGAKSSIGDIVLKKWFDIYIW